MTPDGIGHRPSDLDTSDETVLTAVGPSGHRYFVVIRGSSSTSMLAKFLDLELFVEQDLDVIDTLLAQVLGRAFAIGGIDSLLLIGGNHADRVFAGLGPVEHTTDGFECAVTRDRYMALRAP